MATASRDTAPVPLAPNGSPQRSTHSIGPCALEASIHHATGRRRRASSSCVVVIVAVTASMRKTRAPSPAGVFSVSSDGTRLSIKPATRPEISFDFDTTSGQLRVHEQPSNPVFNDDAHRLVAEYGFETKNVVARDVVSGTTSDGRSFTGLGGYRGAKAMAIQFVQLIVQLTHNGKLHPIKTGFLIEVDDSSRDAIPSFLRQHRELSLQRAKEHGDPP